MKDTFEDDILEMERLGDIYRRIREVFKEEVKMIYADPRNILTIAHYHFSQWRKQRISLFEMLKSLIIGVRRCAIFFNGYWINKQGELDSDVIIERIHRMTNKGEG